jgi:hypothetical protein
MASSGSLTPKASGKHKKSQLKEKEELCAGDIAKLLWGIPYPWPTKALFYRYIEFRNMSRMKQTYILSIAIRYVAK